MNLKELEIKGAVIMTPEQMAADQVKMQGKLIVAGWHYPYNVCVFVRILTNTDKLEQLSRNDEYAGYMEDYNLQVKCGDGTMSGLDGHIGVKYYVFDKLEDARRAVKFLNKLYETDELERSIEHRLEYLSKDLRIGENIAEELSPAIEMLESQFNSTLTIVRKKKKELLGLLTE